MLLAVFVPVTVPFVLIIVLLFDVLAVVPFLKPDWSETFNRNLEMKANQWILCMLRETYWNYWWSTHQMCYLRCWYFDRFWLFRDICANTMSTDQRNCQSQAHTSHTEYPHRWLFFVSHFDNARSPPMWWMKWTLTHTPECIRGLLLQSTNSNQKQILKIIDRNWRASKIFTFPFSGMARFIILAMFAIGRNRSCSRRGAVLEWWWSSESSEHSSMNSSLNKPIWSDKLSILILFYTTLSSVWTNWA